MKRRLLAALLVAVVLVGAWEYVRRTARHQPADQSRPSAFDEWRHGHQRKVNG